MDLNLKFFDIDAIPVDAVILIIGRRGTGKSVIAKDILSRKTYLRRGICISPTETGNSAWGKHIPKKYISTEYDKRITENLNNLQRTTKLRDTVDPTRPEPVFAVFDDCAFESAFFKDKPTKFIFMNGRHFNIFSVITIQYSMDVPRNLRANADFVFVLMDNIVTNRQRLYESFFGMFPNFKVFEKTFLDCTENNECLVLDNRKATNDIEKCVFWYKAELKDNFRLGTAKDWAYQKILEDHKEELEKRAQKKKQIQMRRSRAPKDFQSAFSRKKKNEVDFNVVKLYPGHDQNSEQTDDEENSSGYE